MFGQCENYIHVCAGLSINGTKMPVKTVDFVHAFCKKTFQEKLASIVTNRKTNIPRYHL